MRTPRYHIVSLGCAKNTVDSASMGHLLGKAGYSATGTPEGADVLVVNTCGFIGPAKEESLQTLRELARGKRPGQLLIAAGCLTQRYGAEVARQVAGIDGILGTRRWMDIVQVVEALRGGGRRSRSIISPEAATSAPMRGRCAAVQGPAPTQDRRRLPSPLRICAIPPIKGTAVSRPLNAILEEARRLQDQGVREIILIAQDTTDYGHDQGMKEGLAHLLDSLVREVPAIDWIRVMYAFPGYVTERLIETMASHPQILPYLDMPLQHGHPATLRRMRRPANLDWVHGTIGKMRLAMPELALRSTFIVGFPGEDEAEFQTLLDFVAGLRFDRLGAFTFSFEPGTASEPLGDPVPEAVKEERRGRLMELQQRISGEEPGQDGRWMCSSRGRARGSRSADPTATRPRSMVW
jgi:ribosomal protein S12 methylthiotransferase